MRAHGVEPLPTIAEPPRTRADDPDQRDD